MLELLYRFCIGGALVSLFSLLGDVVRPKSFAGIFGTAPSVALATLALTIAGQGAGYAALETRSMIVGAAATLIYCWIAARWMWLGKASVLSIALSALGAWLALALLGWGWLLRGAT